MVYYPLSSKELKEIIDGYETVSFDIWDTLIARRVLHPEDVFKIVANRAKKQGMTIEDYAGARHDAIFHVERPNPNLTEIYDALQKRTGISDEEKINLMQLEIQVEKEVILPRKEIAEILTYARQSGKKVNLVTDMYLPKCVMEELLQIAGITEYDGLYVSCEYRQLKMEQLFVIYKENVPAANYLHIGDNPNSDVASAERNGMDAVKIKSGLELLKESKFRELLDMAESFNEQCMTGLFCAEMFNSPFLKCDENGRTLIDSPKMLGGLFIAPLITEFMVWLEKELKSEAFDGILFSARDGYLLQKLYEKLINESGEKLPEGRYFLASRQLATFTGIQCDNDIIWLSLVKFNGSRKDLLRYRFCLKEEDILEEVHGTDESVTDYVMRHRDGIYERVTELKENYLSYMKHLGLKEQGRYVFFDFVSSGTCQYYLGRIVPFELVGKYFCRSVNDDEKKLLEIDSLYLNDGVEKADSYLYKNYRYLETIMTSPMPSVRYVDEQREGVYDEETRSEAELQFVGMIHEAVEDYFAAFLKMYNEDTISREFVEKIYQFMDNEYAALTCTGLSDMELRDDWVRETAAK